jgi:hypothetical protein
MGLAPMFKPASPAQASFASVKMGVTEEKRQRTAALQDASRSHCPPPFDLASS